TRRTSWFVSVKPNAPYAMVVAAGSMKVVGFGGDDAMVVAVGVRCGGRWRCRLIRGEDGVVVEAVVEMVTG
ncbi:hypothetical protein Tco_0436790, partial [Tanacetum coccineum]